MARDEPGRFDPLLSEADVDALVCSGGLRHPEFRLVKEGASFAVSDYSTDIPWRPDPLTGVIDVARVVAEWEAGATIVLQALHHTWPPLAALCGELEAELGHAVQANAYYTPRRSQGLDVHHDTHDVFVLQVAGEKRWRVYEPALELPLRAQRYTRALGEPGAPVLDVTVRAGDTLYLPRGWLHEALTSETDSLHVTVGVNVHTWLDALKAAVDACRDDVEFRRAADEAPPADLLERLAERLTAEEVAARRRASLERRRRPLLVGQLAQLRALDRLELGTSLERRPGVIVDVEAVDGQLALAFAGKRVLLPGRLVDEAAFLARAGTRFTAAELPGRLDAAGRLVLVRRLVREGLLRIAPDGLESRRSGEGA